MKKAIAAILVLAMALTMAACGSTETPASGTSSAAATSSAATSSAATSSAAAE